MVLKTIKSTKDFHVTNTIISEIQKYIATQILKQPNRKITIDESLISSGLIDSFSLMDLALFVEDTFGVRIEDTELNANTFDNLTQLASLIESRKA
jgi:acyl carrier protein